MSTRITEEQLTADLTQVAQSHSVAGRLTSNKYREHGSYSVQAVITRWGSWREACVALGLKTSPKGRKKGKATKKIKTAAADLAIEGGDHVDVGC